MFKNLSCGILFFSLTLLSFSSFADSNCDAILDQWNSLSQQEKKEALEDYAELPFEGLDLVTYADYSKKLDIQSVTDANDVEYIKKLLKMVDDEVSREDIEQSDYQIDGKPRVSELVILKTSSGKILGGRISMFQNGLDEDGEDNDINWSVTVHTDENAEPIKDENGQTFDELYYEWSGH